MKTGRIKSGIAFGGGGTRGFAHIGAIRVFQENHIDFDYVAGNSAGAIAGALYAAGVPWQELYDFACNIREKNVLPKKPIFSYMSSEIIEQLADCFLKGKDVQRAQKTLLRRRGRFGTRHAGDAVARQRIQGAFGKLRRTGRIPAGAHRQKNLHRRRHAAQHSHRNGCARWGAERVVGINLNAERGRGTQSLKRLDVFLTAYNLSVNVNSQICAEYADFMLTPALDPYRRHQIKSIREMIQIGEEEARLHLDEIQALLCNSEEASA